MPSTTDRSFSASYDRTTKIVSGVFAVVLLAPVLSTQRIWVGCLAAVIYVLAYAYSPRRYTISGRAIVVRRLVGDVRIPLDGVREARVAHADDLAGTIRLWGDGGLFGYYGLFRTSKLGRCRWYVTNRANMVVVIGADRTTLFSPDDVEGFLASVRAVAPGVETAVSGERRSSRGGNGKRMAVSVGVGVAVLALALVIFAVSYSPGPPSYTLTPAALSIHDRFYPVMVDRGSIDVDHIRVVNLATDPDWKPVARTSGFSNGHYQSGWFRAANGQKVRLYRAGSNMAVLLPPKSGGAAVLLEVKDPEDFVRQACREWSGRCG